jgi:hypothetical protein
MATKTKYKKPVQLPIPEEFAKQYLSAASGTYQYIGDDVEALGSDGEGGKLSRAAWVEIVRDANYISSYVQNHGGKLYSPEFVAWLKVNEYNEQFGDSMDDLVGQAIFGRI